MKTRMKAGVLHAVNDIRCDEVAVPEISDDEILVKVSVAGICGSDYERVLKTGTWRFPTVLGHEFGGLTVETGKNVVGIQAGDKVVVNPMVPCGECYYCKLGQVNMCKDYDYLGSRSNGGFAEYAKVKYTNAYKVSDDMSYEAIASIDPVTVSLHTVIRGDLRVGETVAVFGAGPIGHYCIEWAKKLGASQVIAIDLIDKKLEIAKAVGADYCINPLQGKDVIGEVRRLTDNEGVNLAIESAGSEVTINNCIDVTRKHGKIVCVGTPHKAVTLGAGVFESILRKELTVSGSWCYQFAPPIQEWLVSIDNVYNRQFKVDPVITHRFPLEKVAEAFDMIRDKKEPFNKVLIEVGE